MINDAYFLVVDGKPQGPFTTQQLLHQKILPNSYLKNNAMPDYKQAHEIEEIRTLLNLKQQFTSPQYFAGFDLRLLAAITDWFIVIGTILTLNLAIYILTNNQPLVINLLLYSLFVTPILKFGYQVLMEIYLQATLGKKLLSIKVTDLNGQKPNVTKILIRNLYKIVSTAPFFMGYLYSFLNKKQQCLHDFLAGTLVIKDRLL